MSTNTSSPQTTFTKLTGAKYPIIAGPMFLVSDERLTIAACKAGVVGGLPSLNWRTTKQFKAALETIKKEVNALPFAVNIIVNKSNIRAKPDLKAALDVGTPIFITSLGNPKTVIEEAHKIGAKVFCDVTTLKYAKKVQDLGADGVIAVGAGAGGHAGPTSPFVFIPHLKKHLNIPIIYAGGVATGQALAGALLLGASAVQIGTRFIASKECKADQKYKQAIIDAEPEDIVLTEKISGTPASVIKNDQVMKAGLHLNALERFLLTNKTTKKYAKMWKGLKGYSSWKNTYSAGQGVGMIHSVESMDDIVQSIMKEFSDTTNQYNSGMFS